MLTVSLMEHQEQGLRWMIHMEQSHRHGGILADDMGLGKTVQTLALIASRQSSHQDRRTTLVVAPAGLISQWKREIERLLPADPRGARVRVHSGPARQTRFSDLSRYQIVLTTYNTLVAEFRRGHPESPLLGRASKWHRVVLDEAQYIKNDRTKAAMACCILDASYRWCLSGTPVMNSLREFYSLLRFLRVHPYADLDVFNTVSTRDCRDRLVVMAQLQDLVREIMLRRTQTSTLGGRPIVSLPAKHITTVYVTFRPDERRLYTALESRTQHHFGLFLHHGGVRRNDMLSLLQRLQQACCHPFLIPHVTQEASLPLELNAKRFTGAVVARLRDNDRVLDCPICLTQVDNPLIFFPCGHSICVECFERVAADDRLHHHIPGQGNRISCPACRAILDLSHITDYASFVQCHYIPRASSASGQADLLRMGGSRDGVLSSTFGEHTDNAAADSDLLTHFGLSSGGLSVPQRVARALHIPVSMLSLSARRKQSATSQAARRQYRQDLEAQWIGSAKIDRALEIVHEIQRRGYKEKVVIFSQFTALLDLLAVPLLQRGWVFERYDGSMTPAARDAAVASFTAQPDCGIMLMSLKAGNAGLNLACASEVILLDPFWNPYVEDQAVGRVYRIGQQRPVHVHRILVQQTIEDRILALQNSKRQLIEGILGENAALSSGNPDHLRREDLAYLLVSSPEQDLLPIFSAADSVKGFREPRETIPRQSTIEGGPIGIN
ncbi:hypothetical protein BO82DRAFT_409800 [Aspergillus uvarum CBS 121591]|uniref:SWI/SNF family DNA-dependent ATPase Ris1 n=1 Tax=Aspergillus uvarum CBS 121591 TaxID=1448315 RepID=A0A319BTG0_9EURO|nr:hypothetical protein BO82DRAFT_409800 [Aspergillus uvarum CBS 121591]PYH75607.1 hypothetical protein BO82DRAFT_409800 [Aspergillus uvarum CBS 121591]